MTKVQNDPPEAFELVETRNQKLEEVVNQISLLQPFRSRRWIYCRAEEGSAESIEGATREEVQQKIDDKLTVFVEGMLHNDKLTNMVGEMLHDHKKVLWLVIALALALGAVLTYFIKQ